MSLDFRIFPSFRPRLLAFDLDGTLLPDGTHELKEETQAALQGFKAAGVHIAVITGRAGLQGELAETVDVDVVATCNGAEIGFADGKHVCHFLSESDIEQIAELTGPTLPLKFYFLEHTVARKASPALWVGIVQKLPAMSLNAEMRQRVLKVRSKSVGAGAWATQLRKTLPDLTVAGGIDPYPDAVDVSAREANKGAALQRIAEHFGIPMEQTVAFGDSDNDAHLLEAAAFGVQIGSHAHLDGLADVRLERQEDLAGYLEALLHRKLLDDMDS